MSLSFFTGISREIESLSGQDWTIIIEEEDSLKIKGRAVAFAPLIISGPVNISNGPSGTSILVEKTQTNLIKNSSFEAEIS